MCSSLTAGSACAVALHVIVTGEDDDDVKKLMYYILNTFRTHMFYIKKFGQIHEFKGIRSSSFYTVPTIVYVMVYNIQEQMLKPCGTPDRFLMR